VLGDGREIGERVGRGFAARVRHNSLSNKEKQIWVIRGKKTKAKGNNRKRPSLI
jgi:hypothetical protein